MGSSQSKTAGPLLSKKKSPHDRQYNLPDAREKVRYEPEETESYNTAYEVSIDKFDYLIVFPLTEVRGQHKDPVMDKSELGLGKGGEKLGANVADKLGNVGGKLGSVVGSGIGAVAGGVGKGLGAIGGLFKNDRISWKEIKELWSNVAFGNDDDKARAVEFLASFWSRRTGSTPDDQDMIRMKAWQTLARDAILEKLTTKSGLQCKLTANQHFIFCRIRAPIKLLESKADELSYRLQLRGEIDPGSDEFWNRELLIRDENTDAAEYVAVELEQEKIIYTREDAVKILEKLYKSGKISASDLSIKDETPSQWSLRIHAIERIADKVPVSNKFPVYAGFSSKTEKRHLYNTYPTVRGHTFFRSKDRQCLTKSILDSHFDLEKLEQRRVIAGIMGLHDANRGEKVTKEILQKHWVGVWTADAADIGAPYVTHEAYEDNVSCPWYWRPFSQPLADIRDYFGEKIALYFAWLGYYTCFLFVLSVFSMLLYVVMIDRGAMDLTDTSDWWAYFYFVIVIIWSEIFQNTWLRQNSAIQLKWGTNKLEGIGEDYPRPQFQGTGPLVRSTINNAKIAVFPSETRAIRSLGSYGIIFLLIILNLCLIGGVYIGEYYLVLYYPTLVDNVYLAWGQASLHAFILQTNASLFPRFGIRLNNWENYRTETDFEDALVTKTLVFQVTNNFAAATFTTFGKGFIFDDCSGGSCIGDLRTLLFAIIFVRLGMTVWRLFKSIVYRFTDDIIGKANNKLHSIGGSAGKGEDDDDDVDVAERAELLQLSEESEDDKQFQEEIKLTNYEGTFNSYSESALQFGFVSLFSVAMPLLPVYALLENFFLIRVNAWRLCVLHRRPHVVVVGNIGEWAFFIKFLSYMGPFWGCGIIVFASPNFASTNTQDKVIIFLTAVQVMFYFKVIIGSLIKDVPEWVKLLAKRNEYVSTKYVTGVNTASSNEKSNEQKGYIDDQVDVDALNLYDLRKGQRVSEEEFVAMGELEAKRRGLMKEIRISKEKLQGIYKTENYNDNTGIGETKHGLPLGRLSVKLIQIDGLVGEGLEDLFVADVNNSFSKPKDQYVKIRVNIRASRKSTQAAPDFGALSDSSRFVLKPDGSGSVDQMMGPYAPIRTIDAEVVFSVLNVNDADASIAVASISLRELQDQEMHDLVLPLKARLANGDLVAPGRLFVSVQFQYSKVLPLRRRIYEVQGKLRDVEKDLAKLKAGKK